MPGQQFVDQNRQIIVRLTDDALIYQPAAGKGWACLLADIGWTASSADAHGLREVRIHARNGARTAVLPAFDGLERCYLALLRRLMERPSFHSVREQLPTQAPLMERVLWLACQTRPEDGAWETLHVEEAAGVASTSAGLLLACGSRPLERIPWNELCGVRCRFASLFQAAPAVHFFRRDSYTALPLTCPPDEFLEQWARRAESEACFRLPGVLIRDARLAMDFAPELERARDSGCFRPEETVWACAFGEGRGQLLAGSAAVQTGSVEVPDRTELFLTNRRLLRVLYPAGGGEPTREGVLLDRLPRVRVSGTTLVLGGLELDTDPLQPLDMAGRFVSSYKAMLRDTLDPFAAQPDGVEAAVAEVCSAPAERLMELQRMRHIGFLSDEEYEQQAAALHTT